MLERMSGWVAVLILALLGAGTFWVDRASRVGETQPTLAAGERDFFLSDFRAVQMSIVGKPQYVLVAQHMDHFPEGDIDVLTNPVFKDISPGEPTLLIKSPVARLLNPANEIIFDREVQIVRDASENSSRLVINTSALTWKIGPGTGFTDMPVDGLDDTTHVTAVGMDIDRNASRIRLHEQVRTIYVKPHP
jgi:lipopolysaccharide export system protein LptC